MCEGICWACAEAGAIVGIAASSVQAEGSKGRIIEAVDQIMGDPRMVGRVRKHAIEDRRRLPLAGKGRILVHHPGRDQLQGVEQRRFPIAGIAPDKDSSAAR